MRTAGEISREIPEFLKFRYFSGFGETFIPPKIEGDRLEGFKGWEKDESKKHQGNRRRILRLLQKNLAQATDPGIVVLGLNQSDDEASVDQFPLETRTDMLIDLRNFGLVCGSVDLIFRRSFTGLREVPAHAGITMFDEAVAAMDVIPSIGAKECREAFIKIVMICLLRERSIPLYLTDLSTRALRLHANKNRRGYPIITYENIKLSELFNDIRECRGQGIPSVTEKLKRIRSVCCPCPIGTNLVLSSEQKTGVGIAKQTKAKQEPTSPETHSHCKDKDDSSVEVTPTAATGTVVAVQGARKRGRPPLKDRLYCPGPVANTDIYPETETESARAPGFKSAVPSPAVALSSARPTKRKLRSPKPQPMGVSEDTEYSTESDEDYEPKREQMRRESTEQSYIGDDDDSEEEGPSPNSNNKTEFALKTTSPPMRKRKQGQAVVAKNQQ